MVMSVSSVLIMMESMKVWRLSGFVLPSEFPLPLVFFFFFSMEGKKSEEEESLSMMYINISN